MYRKLCCMLLLCEFIIFNFQSISFHIYILVKYLSIPNAREILNLDLRLINYCQKSANCDFHTGKVWSFETRQVISSRSLDKEQW